MGSENKARVPLSSAGTKLSLLHEDVATSGSQDKQSRAESESRPDPIIRKILPRRTEGSILVDINEMFPFGIGGTSLKVKPYVDEEGAPHKGPTTKIRQHIVLEEDTPVYLGDGLNWRFARPTIVEMNGFVCNGDGKYKRFDRAIVKLPGGLAFFPAASEELVEGK